MLLYHINVGFPFVDDGAELAALPARRGSLRRADPERPEEYARFIAPQSWVQQTFEHAMLADAAGRVPVAIVNPRLGANGQALYVIYDRAYPAIEWR